MRIAKDTMYNAINPVKKYIYREDRWGQYKFMLGGDPLTYKLVDKNDVLVDEDAIPFTPFHIDLDSYGGDKRDLDESEYETHLVYTDVKYAVIGKPLNYFAPESKERFWQNILLGYLNHKPGTLNCVIDAVHRALPQNKKESFLNTYGNMKHEENIPKFVDIKFMHEMGKHVSNNITLRLYTEFGYAINQPSITIGRNKGKVIELLIYENQADLLPNRDCGEIEYIDEATEINLDNFIQYEPCNNLSIFDRNKTGNDAINECNLFGYKLNPTELKKSFGWREYKNNRILLKKYLKPSTVTGNPIDDEDVKYYKCITIDAVFAKRFAKYNEFMRTPMGLYDIIKQAAIPFSQFNFAPDNQDSIEVDQNASYASYENNEYYQGFPSGYWRHVGTTPDETYIDKVAFVEVTHISPRENDESIQMYINLQSLCPDVKVIPGPLYRYLRNYLDFQINSTIYAEHRPAHLQTLLQEVKDRLNLNENQCKILRNTCLGRLVGGGTKNNRIAYTFVTRNPEYSELLIGEIEATPGASHTITVDNGVFNITAKVPTNKQANYLHQYTYVLAYSKISTLKQLLALQMYTKKHNLSPPTSVHVDAIRMSKQAFEQIPKERFNIYHRQTRYVYGEWKYTKLAPSHVKPNTNEPKDLIFAKPHPYPVNPIPLYPQVVITGPPGVCKTANIIKCAPRSALYAGPTKELRKKTRIDLQRFRDYDPIEAKRWVVTYQLIIYHYKIFMYWRKAMETNEGQVMVRRRIDGRNKDLLEDIKTLSVADKWKNYRFFKSRFIDIIKDVQEIYLDEFTKAGLTDMILLKKIAEDRRIFLTVVGDYEQTINEIEPVEDRVKSIQASGLKLNQYSGVTKDNLEAMGFIMFDDPRSARSPADDKGHRHNYEYGNFLDTMRGKSPEEQIQIAIDSGRYQIVEAFTPGTNDLFISGRWSAIAEYNAKVPKDMLINVRDLKTREMKKALITDANVWSTKTRMEETAPKGKTHIAYCSTTVDACQGETFVTPVILDVNTLTKHGAFYTAISRTPTADLVVLRIAKNK
jgi:hypothetical protein